MESLIESRIKQVELELNAIATIYENGRRVRHHLYELIISSLERGQVDLVIKVLRDILDTK